MKDLEDILLDVIHLSDNRNRSKDQIILKMEFDTYLKEFNSLVQKAASSQNSFRCILNSTFKTVWSLPGYRHRIKD